MLAGVVVVAGAARAGYDEGAYAAQNQNTVMAGESDAERRADLLMLVNTQNEEKTEIQQLAAQRAAFLRLGGSENRRIASMFGRWIRDHKAAGPTLMRLIAQHGGDPNAVQILKPPALGAKHVMLHATMVDHMKAESTSQLRFGMTQDAKVKAAMRTRANIARKHMRQMQPYHNARNCPQCAVMMRHQAHAHPM